MEEQANIQDVYVAIENRPRCTVGDFVNNLQALRLRHSALCRDIRKALSAIKNHSTAKTPAGYLSSKLTCVFKTTNPALKHNATNKRKDRK
jgi:hypothetical protein